MCKFVKNAWDNMTEKINSFQKAKIIDDYNSSLVFLSSEEGKCKLPDEFLNLL